MSSASSIVSTLWKAPSKSAWPPTSLPILQDVAVGLQKTWGIGIAESILRDVVWTASVSLCLKNTFSVLPLSWIVVANLLTALTPEIFRVSIFSGMVGVDPYRDPSIPKSSKAFFNGDPLIEYVICPNVVMGCFRLMEYFWSSFNLNGLPLEPPATALFQLWEQ